MDRAHSTDLGIDNAAEPTLSVTAALMHPDDVISNLQLTRAQRREILASWASDARAVPDMPALRQLDNGAIVRVDDVLCALSALDDDVRFGQRAPLRIRPIAQRHNAGVPFHGQRSPCGGSPGMTTTIRRRVRPLSPDRPAVLCQTARSLIRLWQWLHDHLPRALVILPVTGYEPPRMPTGFYAPLRAIARARF